MPPCSWSPPVPHESIHNACPRLPITYQAWWSLNNECLFLGTYLSLRSPSVTSACFLTSTRTWRAPQWSVPPYWHLPESDEPFVMSASSLIPISVWWALQWWVPLLWCLPESDEPLSDECLLPDPYLNLMSPSVMSASFLSSSLITLGPCVMEAGCSIRLSTPPRDTASSISCTLWHTITYFL